MSSSNGLVVVVGAGPVGMGLAACLVHRGLRTLVVEENDHISTEWRASTFHPPTLEQLASTGLTDLMIRAGLKASRYQIRDRKSGLVAEFDYSTISEDTPYPFRLQLEQYKFVEMARDFILASGLGEIRLGTRLAAIEQGRDSVGLALEGPSGVEHVDADFMVGADGAHSTTRNLLGISFDGWTYEQKFLLISTNLPFEKLIPDLCHVNYVADPEQFVMLLKIPDVWRVLVPVSTEADEAEVTAPDYMHQVLEGIVGEPLGADRTGIVAHQLYRVHQRVAETFHIGRVALAGDAAHLNSPIGGFGLNSGLHDSFDLAARLDRLRRRAVDSATAEQELSMYTGLRRRVALEHVRAMSDRNTKMLMRATSDERRLDQQALREIAGSRSRTREFLLNASMISAAREHGFGVGARVGSAPD